MITISNLSNDLSVEFCWASLFNKGSCSRWIAFGVSHPALLLQSDCVGGPLFVSLREM